MKWHCKRKRQLHVILLNYDKSFLYSAIKSKLFINVFLPSWIYITLKIKSNLNVFKRFSHEMLTNMKDDPMKMKKSLSHS